MRCRSEGPQKKSDGPKKWTPVSSTTKVQISASAKSGESVKFLDEATVKENVLMLRDGDAEFDWYPNSLLMWLFLRFLQDSLQLCGQVHFENRGDWARPLGGSGGEAGR